MNHKTVMLFTAALIGIAILGVSCKDTKNKPASPAMVMPQVQVGYSFVQEMPLTELQDYVGQVAAWEKITVPVRISGILKKNCFKDGDFVKKGTAPF